MRPWLSFQRPEWYALVDYVSARLYIRNNPVEGTGLTYSSDSTVSEPYAMAVRIEDRTLLAHLNDALYVWKSPAAFLKSLKPTWGLDSAAFTERWVIMGHSPLWFDMILKDKYSCLKTGISLNSCGSLTTIHLVPRPGSLDNGPDQDVQL